MLLKNTLFYTVFNVLFTMIISFCWLYFLNRNQWITKFARSCMYIPYVTSMVVAAMIWLWMYEPHGGVFNEILKALGLQPVKLAASRNPPHFLYHYNECVEGWL